MTERSIQSSILNYLSGLSSCYAYNMHGSAWSGSGRPDIVGCYRGIMFVIEIKRPGYLPTKIQLHEMNKWRKAGAIPWIATSLQHVIELIAQIDEVKNDYGIRKSE